MFSMSDLLNNHETGGSTNFLGTYLYAGEAKIKKILFIPLYTS